MATGDFIPKTQLSQDGMPCGRRYWGLPVHNAAEMAKCDETSAQVIGDILEQNIKELDSAFGQYAKEAILGGASEGDRIRANCCAQAIHTLTAARELVLALR